MSSTNKEKDVSIDGQILQDYDDLEVYDADQYNTNGVLAQDHDDLEVYDDGHYGNNGNNALDRGYDDNDLEIYDDNRSNLRNRSTGHSVNGGFDLDIDEKDDETRSLLQTVSTLKKRIGDLQGMTREAEKIAREADKKAGKAQREVEKMKPESESQTRLEGDIFTLMTTNGIFTKSWWFGLLTFLLQMTLLGLICASFITDAFESTPFNVPASVETEAYVAQFLAMIVSIMLSKDIIMPIKDMSMLWISNRDEWTAVIENPNATNRDWAVRILLPNTLKFFEGISVLFISFVIIIQSEEVIVLFKDFAAMQLIAEIDDFAFWLASQGFFGGHIKNDTIEAKRVRVTDDVPKICFSLPLRPIVLVVLFTIMTIGFIPIIIGQESGDFFEKKYPSCNIPKDRIKLVNDGRCDGGVLNTPQCGFEGGDCRDFNLAFPGCEVSAEAYKVGDGKCDEKFNNEKCKFDGGDCCPVKNSKFLGDGVCHAGYFDTKVCNFDDTDCKEFREKYPNCPQKMNNVTDRNGSPVAIGDGKCEFNVNTTYLFTEECGFSDGDCKECKVDDPSKLANGICDGGKYNTEECNFDGGDCNECNEMLKSKKLNVSKIGDGTCDGHEYHTITACNEDGGDCANCEVDDYFLIGDGTCDGKKYMSEGCSKDGGDCKDCDVEDPFKIGDGVCDGGNYMTVGCNRDGRDCELCRNAYTYLDNTFVGNGKCDGREFNIEGCDYDGGDCKDCNEKLDNLGLDKDKLGDGTCDGGDYMTIECGRDGGDCDKCKVADPNRIGNGICDVEFNTPECSHDGGDCLVEGLPDCYVEDPSKIKDGKCHGGNYTLKECNYDGGDCKDFVEKYPNCSVPDPEKVTDQTCDAKENSSGEPLYNVASCDYDGGACFTVNNETLQKYPNCSIVSPVEVGWIGNGECNKELNVAACEHDGGDCVDFNNRFPNCTAESPWRLFDKSCFAYLPYNSAECGWDGGDCDELNEKMRVDYPDCKSDSFGLLANDRCDYDLNTDDCGFDDGKCAEFETKYPGCLQFFSNNKFDTRKIGDGHCDGLPFNVDECKYDGGDCDERNNDINNEFPNCHVAQIGVIKDGFCNSAANNEACGWDGGDCLDFNANYLECKTDKPYKISNRHCDPEYNTTECKYDGGDCLL